MENLLKIVEEPSSALVNIYAEKPKLFTTKVKIWDYASLSLNVYQKMSVEDRSSVLQKLYVDIYFCLI